MNPFSKFALLAGLAFSATAAVADTPRTQQENPFLREMNRCMENRGAVERDCALSSAISIGADKIDLRETFDLSAGNVNPVDPTDGKECVYENGNKFSCDLYDCGSSGGQSVCKWIGWCVYDGGTLACNEE